MKKFPQTHFVVAGEGELQNELETLAKELGIKQNTHFIGRCTKVPELLSLSFACVLTSFNEGFSNSILEYMAAAKPVVVTEVGGAGEAVIEDQTGFLVKSNDDVAMAEKLIWLLENPERAAEMGKNGRKRVEEEFSTKTQLEKKRALLKLSNERRRQKNKSCDNCTFDEDNRGQSIQAQRLREAFAEDQQIEMRFIPNNPEAICGNVKFLKTIFTSLKFWLQLLQGLPKADIVHIFSSGTTSYLISTLPPFFIARLFGKVTILNYHTGEAAEHLEKWKLTAKPTMKRFDKILVPSQFLVDVFARFGLQAEAISNFVDIDKFKFYERKVLQPVFLSNRNFEDYYNVGGTIRAFAEIQRNIRGEIDCGWFRLQRR